MLCLGGLRLFFIFFNSVTHTCVIIKVLVECTWHHVPDHLSADVFHGGNDLFDSFDVLSNIFIRLLLGSVEFDCRFMQRRNGVLSLFEIHHDLVYSAEQPRTVRFAVVLFIIRQTLDLHLQLCAALSNDDTV